MIFRSLRRSGLPRLWERLRRRFSETRLNLYASQITYYILFSLIPFLMLAVMSVRRVFPAETAAWLEELRHLLEPITGELPDDFWETLFSVSVPGLSLTVLSLLWAASKGMRALSHGLQAIYGSPVRRSFPVQALLALLYTGGLLLLLLISAALLFFGQTLLARLTAAYPGTAKLLTFLWRGKGLFSTLFFAAAILLLNKAVGAREKPVRQLLPGALFSGAGWVLFSECFALYVRSFSSYATLYGVIGGFMILLIWLRACVTILLLGAEMNVFLAGCKVM